jgi:hypothetical protein
MVVKIGDAWRTLIDSRVIPVQDHDAFVNIETGTMENVVGAPMDVIVKYLQDWGVYEALKKTA